MDEIMEKINNAFKLISSIPVQGDFVEIMASAKENLRAAFQLAEELNAVNKQEKTNG